MALLTLTLRGPQERDPPHWTDAIPWSLDDGQSRSQIGFLGFLLKSIYTLKTVTLEGWRYVTRGEQVSKEGLKGLGGEGVSVQSSSHPGKPHFLKQPCWASPGLSPGGLRGRPSTVCPPILVKHWGWDTGGGIPEELPRPLISHLPTCRAHGMQGEPPGSVWFHCQGTAVGTHCADFRPHLWSPRGSSFSTAVNLMTALF